MSSGLRVLVGLYNILLVGLWIYWLRALDTEDDTAKKCSEVGATLRTILYVLAWIGVVMMSMAALIFLFTRKIPYLLLTSLILAVYVIQIQYMRTIKGSDLTVVEDCTELATFKRKVLIVYSILVLIMGIVKLCSAGFSDQALHKKDGGKGGSR